MHYENKFTTEQDVVPIVNILQENRIDVTDPKIAQDLNIGLTQNRFYKQIYRYLIFLAMQVSYGHRSETKKLNRPS